MVIVYFWLLCLYPASYRDEFGEEMTAVFRDAQSALRPRLGAKLGFYQREYCGLLSGALCAHFYRLFGPRIPFRRMDMRHPFRFPRATVVLLLANLVGAIFIMAKGTAMARVVGAWPVFGSVVIHLLVFALLAVCAAAVSWGILHDLRRSGVYRLGSVPTGTHSAAPSAGQ